MQPTIPQDAAFLLPLLGAGLTHWLSSDRLRPWQNASIALIFLVATALACVWLSGNFLLGNPQASVLAVLAYVVLLMNGSLKPILMYVEGIPSPFDTQPTPVMRIPVTPTPIALPTSAPASPKAQEPPK